MPWMDCPRIDVGKSLLVLLAMIAVAMISVLACYLILSFFSVDGIAMIVSCAAILLVELTVFRFIQESISDKLYLKSGEKTESFIVRKGQ